MRPTIQSTLLKSGIAIVGVFLAASAASAKDREIRWAEDLVVARDSFLDRDRSYSEQARRAAREEIERTRKNIGQLSDQQIVASLARAAALSDNAHTRAYLLRNRSYWRRYPLRIWRFDDGWYVVAARADAVPLLGRRISHIHGVPIEQAFEKVAPLYAGNSGWSTYMGTYTLTSPDALMGVGLIDDAVASFSVVGDDASLSVTLRPEPLDPRTTPEESWWFLSPQHPAASGWTHALKSVDLPPALTSPAVHYVFSRCDRDVLYVRYNRASNGPGAETVRMFGERLIESIASQPPRKLVLDLRFNTGGDLSLGQPLIEALARSNLAHEPGAIAVLVGPTTFSAGITPAAWLRAHSKAILVGAHPGDRPDFWAEGGNVTLPNSGLVMHYADGLHQYSDAPVPPGIKEHLPLHIDVRSLEPDITMSWSWRDYIAGVDPIFQPRTCLVSAAPR
ncbi:hypothetical protein [Steroidobacter cummioxidans]|uniref:hypothetical protein n=1 Tax=Steroidobacter cummioxidans TaxID=1803913 RepID=UPI000E31BA93|nr:hypothetical protein [Steroidobacter cummioxidans]